MGPQGNTGEQRTIEIPRDQWEQFLDAFTEFNQETTVRLELARPVSESPVLAEDRPLLAVSLDDEAGPAQVIIECGDTGGSDPAAFRHIVQDPTAVRARKTDPVGWDALEIESRDGTVVLTVNPHPGRETISFEDIGRSEVVT
jgi:hypothetical protein